MIDIPNLIKNLNEDIPQVLMVHQTDRIARERKEAVAALKEQAIDLGSFALDKMECERKLRVEIRRLESRIEHYEDLHNGMCPDCADWYKRQIGC